MLLNHRMTSSSRREWVCCFWLTEIVLQSPSRKFLRGVRKLMADVWRNSLSAAPNLLSHSPTSIKVLAARNRFPIPYSLQALWLLKVQYHCRYSSLYLCLATDKALIEHFHTLISSYCLCNTPYVLGPQNCATTILSCTSDLSHPKGNLPWTSKCLQYKTTARQHSFINRTWPSTSEKVHP